MEKEVWENQERYAQRRELYKSFGCDIDKERDFVLEKAQPLFGDILEVGTGKGHFALTLARAGYRFTSVDIASEEQRLARLHLKYFDLEHLVDFRISDAEHLDFADRSFDIVFSVNTIHHLANPFKVIAELTRVVRFEGKIVLSDFTGEGLKLMEKIHSLEGKHHPAGKASLTDVGDYLSREKFSLQKQRSTFQEVLVAYHQLI